MTMKTLSTVMTVMLLAAGMTPLVVKTWLDGIGRPPVVHVAPTVQVLVMARDVPAGAILRSEDLRYDYWPVYQLSDRLVVKTGGGGNPKVPFLGKVTLRSLSEGEPFSPEFCAPTVDIGMASDR